jgi:outer membrane protein insertion porin family
VLRRAVFAIALLAAASPVRGEPVALAPTAGEPRPIVGVRVRGKSKVTETTMARLAHIRIGDSITPDQVPHLENALISSELFEKVKVTLEDTPGGVLVIATVEDKMSWIAAPTIYVLPSSWSAGLGYAENDLLGEDKKMLLYGQVGTRTSLFFGTYLDPSVNGSPLTLRFDVYTVRRNIDEYSNPPAMPKDTTVGRTSTEVFLDAGALVGWTFAWWLVGDLRLRGAYVYFRNSTTGDDAKTPLPRPEADGWDVTGQARLTLDHRKHRFGVTWGPYAQLLLESSLPGIDSYGYQAALARAYHSWRFFDEHELELRVGLGIGRRLPFHEELTTGGQSDLRGYAIDQFRGDTRAVFRAEYSVPITKWRIFAFRAIGFWDSGYVGFHFQDPTTTRDYLASQAPGSHWWRNDVGAGFRVYVKSVVLPLLGLDLGYGIEGHNPEVYFEVGLTDF